MQYGCKFDVIVTRKYKTRSVKYRIFTQFYRLHLDRTLLWFYYLTMEQIAVNFYFINISFQIVKIEQQRFPS